MLIVVSSSAAESVLVVGFSVDAFAVAHTGQMAGIAVVVPDVTARTGHHRHITTLGVRPGQFAGQPKRLKKSPT